MQINMNLCIIHKFVKVEKKQLMKLHFH